MFPENSHVEDFMAAPASGRGFFLSLPKAARPAVAPFNIQTFNLF
jgi:hypothetical protein